MKQNMNNIKFHCKKGYMKNIPEAYLELCQKPKTVFLQKKSKCLKDVLPTSGVH